MDGGAAHDADRVYREIVAVRERGAEAIVVTVVAKEGSGPAAPGAKMLVEAGGRTVGTVGGGALEALATRRAEALLEAQTSELVRYALGEGDAVEGDEPTGMVCGGRASLFFEYLGQPLRVYLYGAGHVGQAVARALELLPAYVTVIDPRPEILAQVPGARRTLARDYATALDGGDVPAGGYHVIATPGHASDYEVLRAVLTAGRAPRYVALVASRSKATSLLARLRAEEGEDLDLSPLYTPAGLDLGGSSPRDIALSIVAEIQAVRHGRPGHAHLRDARRANGTG